MSSHGTSNEAAKVSRSEAFEAKLVPLLISAGLILLIGLYAWPATRSVLLRRERITLDGFHQAGAKTPTNPDIIITHRL